MSNPSDPIWQEECEKHRIPIPTTLAAILLLVALVVFSLWLGKNEGTSTPLPDNCYEDYGPGGIMVNCD